MSVKSLSIELTEWCLWSRWYADVMKALAFAGAFFLYYGVTLLNRNTGILEQFPKKVAHIIHLEAKTTGK